MYTVEHMKKWQDTGSYMGADLSDWYILVSRTRDSNCLENSNYESILRDLQAKGFKAAESEDSTSGYLVCNFGHWACGWIEAIMIHKDSDDSLLEWADNVHEAIEFDYPVYDEEDLWGREFTIAQEYIHDYVVRDYIADQDYEVTDSQIDSLADDIMHRFEYEINGYDEVIFYNTTDAEIHSYIDKQIEAQKNMRHCSTCGADYDSVNSACDCQIRMKI